MQYNKSISLNIRSFIKPWFNFIILSSWLLVSALKATGQVKESQPLFLSDQPLELTIEADFKSLVSDKRDEEPDYKTARLLLAGTDENNQTFEIKVKARGYSRRMYDFCSFPPLYLNFKKKSVEGTLFQGQDKLKLVTYCKDMDLNENYILQEYMIYKTYNILTDTSFRVRLAKITYHDSEKNKTIASRFGFLIEDIDKLAERLNAAEYKILLPTHDACDHKCLDRFMLFQYMIGNNDWWIAKPVMHNVKLINFGTGLPVPIPYDFDYCGAVNTNYAAPPENLPIKSVRERYFQGFCRRKGVYEKTIQGFLDRKEEIYELYKNFPYLSDPIKKNTLKYFDQFYDIITNPKGIIKRFYDSCPIHHKHLHQM